MILLFVDFSVKVSTVLLSLFAVSESTRFRQVFKNLTAIWFLDQIDNMCANSIQASIDTFASDINKSDNFMKMKFDDSLYAKICLYWIYFLQAILLLITPQITYNRFDILWLLEESHKIVNVLIIANLISILLFPLTINLIYKFCKSKN